MFLVIRLKDMFAHHPPLFIIFLRLAMKPRNPKTGRGKCI
jgi:hypothetical protein